MNKGMERLFTIARKPMRRIIGLMSGTSMDGLDIAVCEVEGYGMNTHLVPTHFETVP
jgi:anhydro-N-acetylmuramic acid kinase